MFIKLTKLDGRPVWLNASFIVTVEPRRDGNGAVVVPIGDGLDYDVRESSEAVLRMLEGAPVPAVVPVPVSDCLTKTPADVSPAPDERRVEARPPEPAEKPADVQPPAAKKEPDVQPAAAKDPVPEKKPRKRTTRAKTKAAKGEEKSAEKPLTADVAAKEPKAEQPEPVQPKPSAFELSPDQVARLAKLAPKSIAKLKNTLATQFHVADIGGTVLALEAKGAFALEGNRVIWPTPVADW